MSELTKNRKDYAEYWAKADEASKEVAKWPKWKRDIKIGFSYNTDRDYLNLANAQKEQG